MQIAVCDDEKVYLDCLSRKIKACFKEFEIEISLDKYLNAVSFLEQHNQNPYDIVFLDILMPEMNGLDVANRIRNLSEKTIIIIITTENHLVYESFDYRPFNFIPKDLDIFDQKLRSVIGKLMFFLQTSKTLCFDLPYGEIGKVTVGDIIYICSRSNYIDIICKSNVKLKIRSTIDNISGMLPEQHFARTHNRIIVNLNHIQRIDYPNHIVYLTDSNHAEISRRYKNSLAEKYKMFIRETT